MSHPPPDLKRNHLLAALPDAEWHAGCPSSSFSVSAIVSLLYVMEDGASAEIPVLGHEGLIGISLFTASESTPCRAVVQSAGKGFRRKSSVLEEEFIARSAALSLVAAGPRPSSRQGARHDAGADREHARRSTRGRHRGRPENAEGQGHRVRARAHHRAGQERPGKTQLRMRCRGEEGIRPPLSLEDGHSASPKFGQRPPRGIGAARLPPLASTSSSV